MRPHRPQPTRLPRPWDTPGKNTGVGCHFLGLIIKGFPSGSAMKNLPAMQENQIQSLGQKDPLEKEMVTNSSILVWEIPWTEETSGLQSPWGRKRVRHNLATKQQLIIKEQIG